MTNWYAKLSCLLIIMAAFLVLFVVLSTPAATRRGDAPRCQDECLQKHTARMKSLEEEYQRTADKPRYQDRVDDEGSAYVTCLTNCREVLQVK